MARAVVSPTLPLLSLLDRWGVRFPAALYRGALLTAFFTGRRQAEAAGP